MDRHCSLARQITHSLPTKNGNKMKQSSSNFSLSLSFRYTLVHKLSPITYTYGHRTFACTLTHLFNHSLFCQKNTTIAILQYLTNKIKNITSSGVQVVGRAFTFVIVHLQFVAVAYLFTTLLGTYLLSHRYPGTISVTIISQRT